MCISTSKSMTPSPRAPCYRGARVFCPTIPPSLRSPERLRNGWLAGQGPLSDKRRTGRGCPS